MSPSSFFEHFRAVTSLSPRQFQKQVRLIEARRLMFVEGGPASSAAFAIGYESVLQFTREYSWMFGQPLVRDVEMASRHMIRYGITVAVHPSRRTVDLVDMHSGRAIAEVDGLSQQVSPDGGEWSVPSVTPPPNQQSVAAFLPGARRMIAADIMGPAGHPVVLGSRQPSAGEVVVTDQDRPLWRKNGVVETVDAAGNYQFQTASGITIRFGSPSIENISDVAANGNWNVPAGAAATFTVRGPNWSLVVDNSGNPTVTTTGNVTVNCQDAKVQASGDASVLAPGFVVLGAAGGKRVVVDGDPVTTGGTVQATQTRGTAAQRCAGYCGLLCRERRALGSNSVCQ